MSPIRSSLLLGAGVAAAGGFQVSRSLRFNSPDQSNLTKTFASAGNRRTFTLSFWYKRSNIAAAVEQIILATASTFDGIRFENGTDKLRIILNGSSVLLTTQVFRDASAWYHFLIAFDTTQGTDTNRIKLYVNGSQITAFDSTSYPSPNYDCSFNSTNQHVFGFSPTTTTQYLNGCLANIQFIDGQQLTPSSFTEVSATTGQLIPKAYSGTYGTNGFYLKFADNSTTAALGTDSSGNGNTWTTNNFSVTAGAGNDSLVDTPTSISATDTGVGGEIRGNYCTLNPLRYSGTLSNGNLDFVTTSGGSSQNIFATFGLATDKWYFEVTVTNKVSTYYPGLGVNTDLSLSVTSQSGDAASGYMYLANGQKFNNGSLSSYGASYTNGDVIGVALDMSAGTITFYKNGTSQGQAFSGITGTAVPVLIGNSSASGSINFGQRAFAYTAPSGFKALCDTNLGAPLVAKPSESFDVVTYAGNSVGQTISGLNFCPDFIWFKARSYAGSHAFVDIARGLSNQLSSNVTNSESTNSAGAGVQSFNSNGFTLGTESTALGSTNGSQTYVGWAWKGIGNSATPSVTNTQGSITSQVRANASAGFSICTFTQPSSSSSFSWGHGLNVAPQLVIMKPRDSSGNWQVYHASTGAQYLWLNSTNAATGTGWSTVNSSIVTATSTLWLGSNVTTVAYCFSPVSGYSSVSSYVGNGSSDGPMVYTGFRPKFILVKNATSAYDWRIHDTSRDPYNVAQTELFPNGSYAEAQNSAYYYDILSNGFKLRTSDIRNNGSGDTYIYYAVAENPFQYARAR